MLNIKEKLKKFFSPIDLTKGCIWKNILLFTIPIIISYVLQQFYVLTDSAICGQTLSIDEVAGVNDTGSLVFAFMQFAFGCTAGFCVITSNRIGDGDSKGLRKSFATQIILCTVITLILTAVAILCIKPLLSLVNVTPKNKGVYDAAYDYCLIIFAGIFAQMFYNFIISILRSIGDSVTPLMFLVISTALNIVLDIVFIKVFHWGVKGAAFATVLTQTLCLIACFIYTFARYKDLRLSKEDFKISFKDIKEHLKQGIPLGFQFSILSIGLIVMAAGTIKFDIDVNGIMVASKPIQNGTNAANKLIEFTISPLSALGTAMVSYVAQNLGAKEYDRIKKGCIQSFIIMFILYAITVAVGMLMSINGFYQRIFLSSEKITEKSLKFGTAFLYLDLLCFFILGALFVMRNAVQGIGKSGWTLAAGVAELIARTLICAFLPAIIEGRPIDCNASFKAYMALSLGDPVAWLLAVVVLAIPFIKYIIKKNYRFLDEQNKLPKQN